MSRLWVPRIEAIHDPDIRKMARAAYATRATMLVPPVSGASGWLDASQLALTDGTSMATWANEGTGGGNATLVSGTDPVYHISQSPNGGPGAVFSAGGFVLGSPAGGGSSAGIFTVAIVCKVASIASTEVFVRIEPGAGTCQILTVASTRFEYANSASSINATPLDTSFHVHIVAQGVSSATYSFDGTPTTSSLPEEGSSSSTYVGTTSGGASLLAGTVCEVLWYKDSALTSGQIASTYTYLHSKWFSGSFGRGGGAMIAAMGV